MFTMQQQGAVQKIQLHLQYMGVKEHFTDYLCSHFCMWIWIKSSPRYMAYIIYFIFIKITARGAVP